MCMLLSLKHSHPLSHTLTDLYLFEGMHHIFKVSSGCIATEGPYLLDVTPLHGVLVFGDNSRRVDNEEVLEDVTP